MDVWGFIQTHFETISICFAIAFFISGLGVILASIIKKRLGILDLLGMGVSLIFLSTLTFLVGVPL